MNLGQAVYIDEKHRVRFRPLLASLISVLAYEACRVPLDAYIALKPPAHRLNPMHRNIGRRS
jgi:hypothetical protein